MINLIKMNIFRLFKMKSFYVTTGIVCFMIIFTQFVSFMQREANSSNAVVYVEELQQEEVEALPLEEQDKYYEAKENNFSTENNIWESLINLFSESLVQLLFIIMATTYMVNDHATGFIKNMVSMVEGRWKLVISKLLTISLLAVIMYIVAALSMTLGMTLFEENVTYNLSTDCLSTIGLSLLNTISFGTLILAIVELTRSKVIGLTAAICLDMGIIGIFGSLINMLFDFTDFTINDYFITYNMSSISSNIANSDFYRIMMVSIIGIVLYLTAAIISMRKKDVN